MKTLAVLLLSLSISVFAQTPPPVGAYISSDGVNWNAWSSAAGFGAISYTPPPAGLYCQASSGAPWTPCVPGSGGGSVSITSSTGDLTVSPSPLTGTGIINLNLAANDNWTGNHTFNGLITPTTIESNGTNCAVVWKNPAGTVVKIELFACAAVTDYSNGSTVGSLEWAINQLGTNGGEILMHPGIYDISASILIDWDWITIEGTELPYWSCCGGPWPNHDVPGTPGGAQIVTTGSGGYSTFSIGNTSANMHGDARHKGIEIKRIYGYGGYLTGTSFITDVTAAQHDDWMRLEDDTLQGYESCAITEQWDTHYIIHNTIQNNGGDGICEAGGFYGLISQNIIFDNGGEGVTLSGGTNTIVSENQFGDLTSAGTLSGGTGEFINNVLGTLSSTPLSNPIGWQVVGAGLSTPFAISSAAITPAGPLQGVAVSITDTGGSASFMTPLMALASNAVATDTIQFGLGVAPATNNEVFLQMYYAGSGSANNYACIEFYSGNCLASYWAGGNVGIGYNSGTGAPPSPLSITSANNTPLYVTSSALCCTQFEMANSTGGHSYNFYTNGAAASPGYGGVYDNVAGGDAYAFEGGSTAQFNLHSGGVFGWTSDGARADSSPDTGISRDAAGVVDVGTGAKGSTGGGLKLADLISVGTKFTTSGCSVSSTTGGATAGAFTLGANSCTVVITMNGATGATAPNGWSCQAHDRTAPTVLIGGESSSTTTTATITIPAGAGSTDVISFSCVGY